MYNLALIHAFRLGTALACLTLVGALGMEWMSVRKEQGGEVKMVVGGEQEGEEREEGKKKEVDGHCRNENGWSH